MLAACVPVGACSLVTDLGGYSGSITSGGDGGAETDGPPTRTEDVADAEGVDSSSADADAAEICRPGFTGPSCETPCPAGMAGAACDFSLVFALDIPVQADWDVASDVPYASDRTDGVGEFSRVAYRLVLDGDEVWVELDAFTTNAKRLGVPVDWTFDVPVTNVIVHSFAANQPNVLVPAAGNVELWSDCYPEGPGGVFDHDDDRQNSPDCYGSMQVHVASKPILSFNHWTEGATKNNDIGIGRSPGKHPDWTFAENAASYAKRRLEIYVR